MWNIYGKNHSSNGISINIRSSSSSSSSSSCCTFVRVLIYSLCCYCCYWFFLRSRIDNSSITKNNRSVNNSTNSFNYIKINKQQFLEGMQTLKLHACILYNYVCVRMARIHYLYSEKVVRSSFKPNDNWPRIVHNIAHGTIYKVRPGIDSMKYVYLG